MFSSIWYLICLCSSPTSFVNEYSFQHNFCEEKCFFNCALASKSDWSATDDDGKQGRHICESLVDSMRRPAADTAPPAPPTPPTPPAPPAPPASTVQQGRSGEMGNPLWAAWWRGVGLILCSRLGWVWAAPFTSCAHFDTSNHDNIVLPFWIWTNQWRREKGLKNVNSWEWKSAPGGDPVSSYSCPLSLSFWLRFYFLVVQLFLLTIRWALTLVHFHFLFCFVFTFLWFNFFCWQSCELLLLSIHDRWGEI